MNGKPQKSNRGKKKEDKYKRLRKCKDVRNNPNVNINNGNYNLTDPIQIPTQLDITDSMEPKDNLYISNSVPGQYFHIDFDFVH